MKALLLAALLSSTDTVRSSEKVAQVPAPPAELLENLEFFQNYADTSQDGLWESFGVIASTAAFSEEAAKP